MSDEGFREIQLNGKQLIFMFMAVTVVLVVTFLFGVLTGRGVREGAVATEIATNDVAPEPGLAPAPAPATEHSAPAAPAAGGSTSHAPVAPPAEELSYADRLLRDTQPEEHLKPSASSPPAELAPVVQEPVAPPSARQAPPLPEASTRQTAPASTAGAASAGKPVPAPPAPKETPKAPAASAPAVPAPQAAQPTSTSPAAGKAQASDPSGPGFAVQVAAYPDRRDAEKLVQQLATKGYPAFVMDPVQGAPTKLFRVRVGKYPNRNVAEGVQAQLAKVEQFTTAWIAR